MKRNCDTCRRSPMSVECGKCGTPDYKNFKSKEGEYLRCDECEFCSYESCTYKEPCNGVNRFSSINERKISFERYLRMNWELMIATGELKREEKMWEFPPRESVKKCVDMFLAFHNVEVTNE